MWVLMKASSGVASHPNAVCLLLDQWYVPRSRHAALRIRLTTTTIAIVGSAVLYQEFRNVTFSQ